MSAVLRNVVIIPDSFKGTLASAEICAVLRRKVLEYFPGCAVTEIPVADGGEGSVDAFLAAVGGEKRRFAVTGPLHRPVHGFYGKLPDGTAVVEMAAAAGLPLVGERKDPLGTTTYGVGELMRAALEGGTRRLVVGLGGSATTDGGCGAAAALGVRFLDAESKAFTPTGGTLAKISRIDASGLAPAVRKAEIVAMCDIDNPMHGPQGAAAVFGPQKGSDPEQVALLDAGLAHLAEIIRRDLGRDVAELPGAGAAGAMGAGMVAFCGATLQSGIDTVLDTVRFDELVRNADLVFTGEGMLDSQSLRGKVVIGVARRAGAAGVPVIALVGGADYDIQGAYEAGVTAVFTTNRLPRPLAELAPHAAENLEFAADNVLRALALG